MRPLTPRDPQQKPPPPEQSEFTETNIQMEDSELWSNYINALYLPVEGVDVVAHSREDLNDDRANMLWPGKRRSHMSYFSCTVVGDPPKSMAIVERIPLRVSAVLDENPSIFLILTEIKRTKRLKLNVYQYEARYISSDAKAKIIGNIISGDLNIRDAERKYGFHFKSFTDVHK